MAETCPIPHVADALSPYIRPRAEVLAIRQNLHSYLERHLHLEDTQVLSSINFADPPLARDLQEPPNAFSGVRKAYWRALRAHQVARVRYDDLKAELAEVASPPGAGAGGIAALDVANGGNAGSEVLALVRQREKRRRLLALDRAFSSIEDEDSDTMGLGVDDLVRVRVGEAPVPPSVQRGFAGDGSAGGRAEVEQRILELKKAVLGARRAVDGQPNDGGAGDGLVNGGGGGGGDHAGDREVFALQQVRNELIGWIEKQLALVGEAQEGCDEVASIYGNGEHRETAVSNDEISRLYDGYLDARQRLLETLRAPPPGTPPSLLINTSGHPLQPTTKQSDTTTHQPTTLLPFIPPLLSAKNEEQSHIQQATHVRRQLKSAEVETERLMRRLADESHLVHPGASRGKEWYDAADEAGKGTEEFVLRKVEGGEKVAWEAERAIGEIRRVVGSVEELVGK